MNSVILGENMRNKCLKGNRELPGETILSMMNSFPSKKEYILIESKIFLMGANSFLLE